LNNILAEFHISIDARRFTNW